MIFLGVCDICGRAVSPYISYVADDDGKVLEIQQPWSEYYVQGINSTDDEVRYKGRKMQFCSVECSHAWSHSKDGPYG